MTAEMTLAEAEILIAVLTGAEASFTVTNPPLVEALVVLRPFRSALLRAYLQAKIAGFQDKHHDPTLP